MDNLNMVSVGEIFEQNFTSAEPMSSPLLAPAESLMLWAESGIGKSLFTMHWMIALASGRDFGPWQTKATNKVCYLDMEMSASEISERLKSARGSEYFSEVVNNNLSFISDVFTPDFDLLNGRFDLNNSQTVSMLIDVLLEHDIDVLVVDNLTTASDSLTSENEASALRPILFNLRRITKKGISLVLVHHSTKTKGSYRGSGSLESLFHTILRAERVVTNQSPCLDVIATKSRCGRFKVGDQWRWSFKDGVWTEESAEKADWLKLVLEKAENGTFDSQKALASALGSTPTEISRAKAKLIEKGLTTPAKWKSFFPRST